MVKRLDFEKYRNPALAIDLGLLSVLDQALRILLIRRNDGDDVGGDWALPGGFVHIDDSLEKTARRVLTSKARLQNYYLEQLETFGDPGRDPRGRVVSVAYYALTPIKELVVATEGDSSLMLAKLDLSHGDVRVTDPQGKRLKLAFDHDKIISRIIERLRGKIDYTSVALEFLPEYFTLRDVQEIYEIIHGQTFSKPPFRRKLLDRNIVKPTGKKESASSFRPAELYTRKSKEN